MATSIPFNGTYSGGQVSTGLYSSALGVATYTGSSVLSGATSYALSGAVAATGDTISVTRSVGTVSTVSTATYEGFFSVNGVNYYVFADPTLLGTGGSFVVSATGAAVTLTAAQIITSGVPTAVCFLAGTGILTPSGEVAVETLQAGDLVAVLRDGALAAEPVRWVGHGTGRVGCGAHAIDDAPVRIRAGALDDAIPARDLLVTPEHCLHLDGVLIPARMLVNHGSITRETAHGDYDFFHVELDRHAILLASGAEAESYLDTGNRANFHNAAVAALRADLASPEPSRWPEHAAAPLAVDRATVEPIWSRLADRARALGFATVAATGAAMPDADLDLRIVTATGTEILPTLSDDRVYAFVVPAGTGALRLRSRTARPSEMVGPFLDDRRSLGVQIGRIGVGVGDRRGACDAHLVSDRLPGWHAREADGSRRWTDGDAVLPIETSADDALFLDIEVVGVGPYRGVAHAA